jgi:PAS domain S-box-containing protein
MKILIADDNSDDRKILKQYIEHYGHEVLEAQNGQEGLETAALQRPDLIISDALMPIMDGFQFLRNIKKDIVLRSIPFIFYSAVYRGQKDIELALCIGAEAYIVKPKDPEEFWKELNVIIEKGFSKKVPQKELIEEEEEYLKKYSHIVVSKLEEKVHELNQTIKQLRESRERFKAITDNAAIGIALVNPEKRLVESNPALQRILGYTNKELCGMYLRDFTYPDDVESDVKLAQELFVGKRSYYQIEKRYIRKDGRLVWSNLVTSIVHDAKGKAQYLVNMIEDITERKRTEEELAKYRNHLEELVKVRTAKLTKLNERLTHEIIERKKAQKALQKRHEIQSVLNSMLSISLKPYPLIEMLDRILDCIVSITWLALESESKGIIFLVKDKPNELIMRSYRAVSEDLCKMCARVPYGKCLCGQAASTRKIIFANTVDERHENRYKGMPPHGHYCVPIISSDKLLGVLTLYVKEGHRRNKEEEDFLKAIANVLAGIIERKRGEIELTKYRQHLEDLVKKQTDKVKQTNKDLRKEIKERKQAEKELKTAFEQFQTIMDSLDALVYVADMRTYEVLFINKYGREIWGDVIGKTCWKMLQSAQTGPCGFCTNEKLLNKKGEPTGIYKWECQNTVNKEWYECRDQAVMWVDGRLVRMEIATKITKRKWAEETIKARQKEIQELNINLEKRVQEELEKSRQKDKIMMHQSRLAAMGEMIGNIAHQWRQPLNALNILLYNIADLLDDKDINKKELDELIASGTRMIKKMSTTIDDFRSFYRPEKLKTKFCINEIIKNSLSLADANLKYNCISVQVNEKEKLSILGFPNEFSQVILNIINNAMDAIITREIKGEIKIDIFQQSSSAIIEIEDNGGGIPEDIMNKVFDPYFTTKKGSKGSGLGLYMSKMIIEKHMNGSVDLQNAKDGIKFTITLPI